MMYKIINIILSFVLGFQLMAWADSGNGMSSQVCASSSIGSQNLAPRSMFGVQDEEWEQFMLELMEKYKVQKSPTGNAGFQWKKFFQELAAVLLLSGVIWFLPSVTDLGGQLFDWLRTGFGIRMATGHNMGLAVLLGLIAVPSMVIAIGLVFGLWSSLLLGLTLLMKTPYRYFQKRKAISRFDAKRSEVSNEAFEILKAWVSHQEAFVAEDFEVISDIVNWSPPQLESMVYDNGSKKVFEMVLPALLKLEKKDLKLLPLPLALMVEIKKLPPLELLTLDHFLEIKRNILDKMSNHHKKRIARFHQVDKILLDFLTLLSFKMIRQGSYEKAFEIFHHLSSKKQVTDYPLVELDSGLVKPEIFFFPVNTFPFKTPLAEFLWPKAEWETNLDFVEVPEPKYGKVKRVFFVETGSDSISRQAFGHWREEEIDRDPKTIPHLNHVQSINQDVNKLAALGRGNQVDIFVAEVTNLSQIERAEETNRQIKRAHEENIDFFMRSILSELVHEGNLQEYQELLSQLKGNYNLASLREKYRNRFYQARESFGAAA